MRSGRAATRTAVSVSALACVTLLALGACTGSSSSAPSGSGASTAPGASGSPSLSPSPSFTGRTSPLPTSDPGPLSTVPTRPVRTLPAVPLRSSASFGTGVSAQVTAVTHGTDRDQGPGAATGRPTVEFHLRLRNDTGAAVSLASVQVSATYGSSATPAIAANSSTRPLTGRVAAGGSAEAVYAFAVPSAGQGSVALAVTYAAGRPTVLLTGSAR